MNKRKNTCKDSPDVVELTRAIETAGEWTGMTWDSELAPIGDMIRRGKRVDLDRLTSWHGRDEIHARGVRALVRSIEDQIDEDTDADTREEIATDADRLASEESADVERMAGRAREHGADALACARAGDWDGAVRALENACACEREYGDAPSWGPALAVAERIRDEAEAADEGCGCGEWSGVRCEWSGPQDQMVTVEWMPKEHRASHVAAGNRGIWPHNGSSRVLVSRECAQSIVEHDGEWAEIVD